MKIASFGEPDMLRTRRDGAGDFTLSDEAVDWIEAAANGETT